jgi:hypothetical protein
MRICGAAITALSVVRVVTFAIAVQFIRRALFVSLSLRKITSLEFGMRLLWCAVCLRLGDRHKRSSVQIMLVKYIRLPPKGGREGGGAVLQAAPRRFRKKGDSEVAAPLRKTAPRASNAVGFSGFPIF